MAREVNGNAMQPFRDGLPLLAMAAIGREAETAGSCRYPEPDDACGPTLRPGETAGMFAPEGALVVGVPCAAGDPPARGADSLSAVFGRDRRAHEFDPDAADHVAGEAPAVLTECPPRPGVTTLNDFMRLVAQTRVPFPDQEMDPACYGGGVSGSGDVNGPASSVDDNLVAFDGTTGKLIDDSGIAKATVMTTARGSVTPDAGDKLGLTDVSDPAQPPKLATIAAVNAILDHNIQTNLAVGDVHTQYAKDSGTPGSTGFVPVYTADRQIAPSGVGIPDGAGGENLEVPGLISAPIGLVGTEQASSPHSTAAGQGTFYVRNTLPSKPAFEGDTGIDQLLLLAGDIGVTVQAWDADLDAIAALGSTGIAVRTAANTWAQRSIIGSGRVTVSNGGGVAGDPAITINLSGGNAVSLTTEVTGTLPIANGGTGQISAAAAFNALKQAASDTATGVIEIAEQSEMETGTDTTRAVVPGRQQYHPGHPKCWAFVNDADGTPTLAASYNIASITDNGAGLLTVTIATDFNSANWGCLVTCENPSANPNEAYTCQVKNGTKAAGSVQLTVHAVDTDTLQDPESYAMAGFGDQA